MAMNLRLPPEIEAALRSRARLTGRSQQAIVREALGRYLEATEAEPAVSDDLGRLVASGTVLPPRTPYRRTTPTLSVPDGMTSLDLLDRTDRF